MYSLKIILLKALYCSEVIFFQKPENVEFSTKFFRRCSFSFEVGKSGNIEKIHVKQKTHLDSILGPGIQFTVRESLLRLKVRVDEKKSNILHGGTVGVRVRGCFFLIPNEN